jgi:hypothetical protein
MTSSPLQNEPSVRSPFAGCAILIAALAVMVFLIGFSVLTLFRQFNEIAKFTDTKPIPIAAVSIEGKEVELNALAERLELFRQQLLGDSATSLVLSPAELNLVIASFPAFKELRNTFQILEIQGDLLRIAISFPINGRPRFAHKDEPSWIASDTRFLNGTLVARPQLLKQEVSLSLTDIEVPGKKVAPEFIGLMSPYRVMERYLADPVLGTAMARLTRVEIVGGNLVLSRNPNETPDDQVTHAQVDSASSRLFKVLGVAAVVFLMFAGAVVLIGIRAKARKSRE